MIAPQSIQATLHPGEPAPTPQLHDLDDGIVELASFWRARPTLIFFLRHSGCALCRAHLQEIRNAHAEFQQRGAGVVVVTFADSREAAQIQRAQRLPFPVLVDPSRQVYRAFGMIEGSYAQAIGPDVLLRQAAQALRGNIPYIKAFGSTIKQLGGTVIVDRDGIVRFAHIATPIYNYVPIGQYLAILDGLHGSVSA